MKSDKVSVPARSIHFPKLMISNCSGVIVLMIKDGGEGVVVYSPDACSLSVGHYSDDWSMGSFDNFYEAVTLSN